MGSWTPLRTRTAPARAATTKAPSGWFARWAGREGFSALPAKPETVAAYLAERAADGLSPASLRMDRAAIRHHHSEAGHANPADNEGVRRVMRGLTRRAAQEGRTPRQAAALTAKALEAIRATAHLRRTGPGGRTEGARTARRRGRVDVALISVMRDAMLRRGEAAALTWADVEFRGDGSGRVTVRRSKSDQDGNGATLYVGRDAATELRSIHGPDASPGAPGRGRRRRPGRRTLGLAPDALLLRPRRTGRGRRGRPVLRRGVSSHVDPASRTSREETARDPQPRRPDVRHRPRGAPGQLGRQGIDARRQDHRST